MVEYFGANNVDDNCRDAWRALDTRLQHSSSHSHDYMMQLFRLMDDADATKSVDLLEERPYLDSDVQLQRRAITLRSQSRFTEFFLSAAELPDASSDVADPGNRDCARSALRRVAQLWLPLFPLWGHAVLIGTGHDGQLTNSAVESYFRWVKMEHGRRQTLPRFIRDWQHKQVLVCSAKQ